MGLAKRSWPEIVAHIPRNLGSGEAPSTEPSSGHLGFKLSRIRFDWLKFSCVAVGLLFGSDTIWPELPNESSRNCSSQQGKTNIGKERLVVSKITRMMKHSATNCLLQSYTQVF
jgi:hypothetical protein